MDWPLVIFSLSVIVFSYRGFRRGFVKSIARLLALVSGYLAAIFFTPQFAGILESTTNLEGLATILCASLSLFIGAALLTSAVFWLVGKSLPERRAGTGISAAGGAFVGAVSGLIVGIVAVWIFGFVKDMAAPGTAPLANAGSENRIQNLVSQAASKATGSALSLADAEPELIQFGSAFVAAPGQIALHARQLTDSDDLANLLNDPGNQQVINSGDIEAVKALPAFRHLADNSDLQALMRSSGMVNSAGGDSEPAETLLAQKLVDIWQRMDRVKNNRRAQTILEDAEFQRKIQSGNPLDLLTNAKLLELANILFDENGDASPDKSGQPNSPKMDMTIYRWVDENGKVHYSDKSPE